MVDLMLVIGGLVILVVDFFKKRGVLNIKFVCFVFVLEGVKVF